MAVPHKLNIDKQFSQHAKVLIDKVDAGADLNRGGNINESGSPFEKAFRKIFEDSFSKSITVCSGYFFNSHLEQSSEVDFMLCDENHVLRLPPDSEINKSYVTHTSVRVMGQLKNNFKGLENALEQSARNSEQWNSFVDSEISWPRNTPKIAPLSFVLVGRGGEESKARKIIEDAPWPRPAFILMLEAGLLYAPDISKLSKSVGKDELNFAQLRNNTALGLATIENNQNVSGRLLMWLFFALMKQVSRNKSEFLESFLQAIQRDYAPKFAELETIPSKRSPSALKSNFLR